MAIYCTIFHVTISFEIIALNNQLYIMSVYLMLTHEAYVAGGSDLASSVLECCLLYIENGDLIAQPEGIRLSTRGRNRST